MSQFNIPAGQCNYAAGLGWCAYSDLIGNGGMSGIFQTINTGLVAGATAVTYKANSPVSIPSVAVRGRSCITLASASSAKTYWEIVECCLRQTSYNWLPAAIISSFTNAWSQSWQTRQSGFEQFPSTQIKQNWAFFDPRYAGVKVLRYKRVTVPANGIRVVTFKHSKPTVINWLDWNELSNACDVLGYKSTFYVMRMRSETGIVCGVSSYAGANPPVGGIYPIISPVGADVGIRVNNYYSFRWFPGPSMPTQYGSWLSLLNTATYPGTESITATTAGWVRDPNNKISRYIATSNTASNVPPDYTVWGPYKQIGGMVVNTAVPTNINPILDCAGDRAVPHVNTA